MPVNPLKPEPVVRIALSKGAAAVLGLDDPCRYPDIRRRWDVSVKHVICEAATVSPLVDLVTELHDRATEGEDGFNEPRLNKARCRRAVAYIGKVYGIHPRPIFATLGDDL